MNNTHSHTSKHRSIKWSAVVLGLAAITVPLLGYLAHTDEPAQAPAPAAVQAPLAGPTDLEGEVWWTTTDCPAGVQVPCLDPEADPTEVPGEVAAQLQALIEAQWVCIDLVGTPMADGTVRVEHEQLLQCRQYAYLATDPTRVQLGEDSEDPAYDCRLDGNQMCGLDNQQGVPAGDYSVVAGCETDRECAVLDRQV